MCLLSHTSFSDAVVTFAHDAIYTQCTKIIIIFWFMWWQFVKIHCTEKGIHQWWVAIIMLMKTNVAITTTPPASKTHQSGRSNENSPFLLANITGWMVGVVSERWTSLRFDFCSCTDSFTLCSSSSSLLRSICRLCFHLRALCRLRSLRGGEERYRLYHVQVFECR